MGFPSWQIRLVEATIVVASGVLTEHEATATISGGVGCTSGLSVGHPRCLGRSLYEAEDILRLPLLMVLALLFLCRPEVLAGTPRHHPGYPGRKPELPGTGGLLFQGIPPDGGECVPLIAVQRTQCSTQDTFDEYVEQVRGSSFV